VALISRVEPQVRRPGRVNVYLDERFWLGISVELCLSLGLRPGTEIDAADKQRIEGLKDEEKARTIALRALERRALSEGQLRRKLAEREIAEPLIDATLSHCHQLGLLDDERLAEQLISERRERGQGRRRVEQYLRQSAFEPDLIKRFLDEAFDPAREAEEAEAVLERRFAEGPLSGPQLQRARGYLLRRGFSFGAVEQALAPRRAENEETDPELLAELLRRRYRQGIRGRDQERKAIAYLTRKGYRFEAAAAAVKSASLED
jgi:regulatory protein